MRLDCTIERVLSFLAYAGEHQRWFLALHAPIVSERLDQPEVVLVVPRVRGIQDVLRRQGVPFAHGGSTGRRVSPVEVGARSLPDRRHAVGLESVLLEDARPGKLRYRDDVVRRGARLRVEAPAMAQVVRVEEFGMVLVLHVMHRDHRWDRTEARLEVGERTEPEVETLAPDQISQPVCPALPVTIP